MKILLPNAKEMDTTQESAPLSDLGQESQAVLSVLSQMTPQELADFYKLKLDKAELEWDRWQRIAHRQAKSYPAWRLYDGLMYRYMKRRDLSKEEISYLQESAFIATGFYGLINVFEPIAPHRLDFQGNIKIAEKGLKQFWRSQYDETIQDDEMVVSLLSSEFEAVFSPKLQKKMLKIVFMEDKNGQLKIHSTISKKGRGRLLSEMAAKQIQTIEAIKELTFDDFVYRSDLSQERELVFVRPSTAPIKKTRKS